jgi:hypothetical protein
MYALCRYETSFAEDLGQFMNAMESATSMIDSGEDAVSFTPHEYADMTACIRDMSRDAPFRPPE